MNSNNIEPRLSQKRINHYFNLAHNACFYSDNKRIRLGCVIVYKSKIISVGYNHATKTNPMQKKYNHLRGYDPEASTSYNTIHAECHALLQAKDIDIEWNKANIFVYRIKKDGSKGLARPCPACEAMIKNMGIENIYYSTDKGWGYEKYE